MRLAWPAARREGTRSAIVIAVALQFMASVERYPHVRFGVPGYLRVPHLMQNSTQSSTPQPPKIGCLLTEAMSSRDPPDTHPPRLMRGVCTAGPRPWKPVLCFAKGGGKSSIAIRDRVRRNFCFDTLLRSPSGLIGRALWRLWPGTRACVYCPRPDVCVIRAAPVSMS